MRLTALSLMIGLLSSGAYAATQEVPATVSTVVAKPGAATAAMQGDPSPSVTATCKDGTSFSGSSKKGACSGHKGVKTWGNTSEMAGTDADPKADTKAGSKTEMKADEKAMGQKVSAPLPTAAAGGGAGKVWVNSKSNTYHCQTDRYYGKTKQGAYMTEAEAKAKGAHADHGKACA